MANGQGLIICSAEPLTGLGLKHLLTAHEPFLALIAETQGPEEALRELDLHRPALLVAVSPSLAQLDAYIAASPESRVMAICSFVDVLTVKKMFKLGIDTVMLRDDRLSEIQAAAQSALQGRGTVCPRVAMAIATADERALTDRELQVCAFTAAGYTSRQTAEMMYLSARTIESYRTSMNRKLGIDSRQQLVRYAIENDLLDPNHWPGDGLDAGGDGPAAI